MATILVLDDIETNRRSLGRLLSRQGHRVVEASNGAEGLGIAKVEKPDLVISDVLMPKMDGPEFVRALRADTEIMKTPVIFYTAAYEEEEIRSLAERSGVRHILRKPSDPGTIMGMVETALGSVVEVDDQRAHEASQREHLNLLNEKLVQKVAELDRVNEERQELLSHLINAQDEERRRIAADLHDDSIQVMTAAGMRMQMLKRKVSDEAQLQLIENVESTISDSINRLRRLMFRLRPPALEREGLKAAIEGFVRHEFAGTGLETQVHSELQNEPPYGTRAVAYQITTEALMNVLKHAHANRISIILAAVDHKLLVTVKDDGRGFMVEEHSAQPGHLGLINMRERAQMVGGDTRISSAPGVGTKVDISVPWEADTSDTTSGSAVGSVVATE